VSWVGCAVGARRASVTASFPSRIKVRLARLSPLLRAAAVPGSCSGGGRDSRHSAKVPLVVKWRAHTLNHTHTHKANLRSKHGCVPHLRGLSLARIWPSTLLLLLLCAECVSWGVAATAHTHPRL
jgi:hypothetical protein